MAANKCAGYKAPLLLHVWAARVGLAHLFRLPAVLLVAFSLCGCTAATNHRFDRDGDGWDDALDYGPADAEIFPGQDDPVGDGIDSNWDGMDGVDADGHGSADALSDGDDCDDTNASIQPGGTDVWCDGDDQDCNGSER